MDYIVMSLLMTTLPVMMLCDWKGDQVKILYFCCFTDKTVKLWKISEKWRNFHGWNLLDQDGRPKDQSTITELKVPRRSTNDISIEAMPRRVFANAHTYHINSISVSSDDYTFLSADDLRVNIWHIETTDRSFSILYSL